MRLQSGRKTSCTVCEGNDGRSFRIVLDDAIHLIEEGETLQQAVVRQQAEWTRKVWNEWPNEWVITEKEFSEQVELANQIVSELISEGK